jgi:putative copper resistance protein D
VGIDGLDPGAAVAVVVAAWAYAAGVGRLAARGRPWPPARSAAFALAVAALVVATQGPVAARDTESFTAHAVQHALLGLVAPVLLALSAPLTLALQAAGRATQTSLVRLLHSAPVATLTHPAAASAVFAGTLFALYFTPLFELSLRNGTVHAAVHVHFVAAGCLYFWPLVGVDAVPHRLPHGVRMLVLLASVPVHAVLGVALVGGDGLLAPGWYDLAGQRAGGGVLWVAGDLLAVAAAAVVLAQWMRDDERAAAREDRRLDTAPSDAQEIA